MTQLTLLPPEPPRSDRELVEGWERAQSKGAYMCAISLEEAHRLMDLLSERRMPWEQRRRGRAA